MATTSGNPTTVRTSTLRGVNGGNHGRVRRSAAVVAGMVLLGCAAVLAFGGLSAADTGRARPPGGGAGNAG